MKINLRDEVKDTLTDFKGIVVARCIYLNGCVRCQVQPRKLDKDGLIIEGVWIDEGQLTIKEFGDELKDPNKEGPGGPADKPKYMNKPK